MNGMMRGGKLKKVELPRFNLSLLQAQDSKVLICEQFPEYMLNTKESVKNARRSSPLYSSRKWESTRKVILSTQDLRPRKQKKFSYLDMR